MTARYWIAQHIADLFRNEARNVGVFVHQGSDLLAQFFGEVDVGHMDGRKIKGFPYPDVYMQWVGFWRRELLQDGPNRLVETKGSHYRVIEGGVIDGTEGSSTQDVLNYLYSILVSEGGLTEALGKSDAAIETAVFSFVDEVASKFRENQILFDISNLIIPHPIRRSVEVRGRINAVHVPAFVQENGRLSVMETIDFTTKYKQRSRDHAGWSAYMFSDVKAANVNTETIAIVKVTEDDRHHNDVANGLAMLQAEAEIIPWLESGIRASFMQDRLEFARH